MDELPVVPIGHRHRCRPSSSSVVCRFHMMDRLFKRKPSKELAWTVALAAAVPLARPQGVPLPSPRPLAQQKRSLFARSEKKFRLTASYVCPFVLLVVVEDVVVVVVTLVVRLASPPPPH